MGKSFYISLGISLFFFFAGSILLADIVWEGGHLANSVPSSIMCIYMFAFIVGYSKGWFVALIVQFFFSFFIFLFLWIITEQISKVFRWISSL
jgi:hypothetical protein